MYPKPWSEWRLDNCVSILLLYISRPIWQLFYVCNVLDCWHLFLLVSSCVRVWGMHEAWSDYFKYKITNLLLMSINTAMFNARPCVISECIFSGLIVSVDDLINEFVFKWALCQPRKFANAQTFICFLNKCLNFGSNSDRLSKSFDPGKLWVTWYLDPSCL